MKYYPRMRTGVWIGLALCLGAYPGVAQKLKKADKAIAGRLTEDMAGLRQDSGGETPGACSYLSAQFGAMGVEHSLKVVSVDEGRVISPRCVLRLDGKIAAAGSDFFPLAGSPDAHTTGSSGISLNEAGLPWIHDLKYDLEGGKGTPSFDIRKVLVAKAREAKKKGATALLLYNSSAQPDGFHFDGADTTRYAIPVVYINKELSNKAFKDPTAYVDVDLTVATQEKKYKVYSVEATINTGAQRAIILEAAFDTADGAAALLELARLVRQAGWKKHNYLFLAYQGGRATPPTGPVDCIVNVEGLGNPHPLLNAGTSQAGGIWAEALKTKRDEYLQVVYGPADTAGLPPGCGLLRFSSERPGAPGTEGEALAVRYLFNVLSAAEKK
jgi:hypothetical protein